MNVGIKIILTIFYTHFNKTNNFFKKIVGTTLNN